MSFAVFTVLTLIGFCWGVFGGYILGPNPPLLLGWLPLSVASICLTGIYASLINWLFFKNYGEAD